MQLWADKIGADFHVIRDRIFPDWPCPYEKLQMYRIAQEQENDWNIFFDADCMVHSALPDITCQIPPDTVANKACDPASIRFASDRFFRRDGRNIGTAGWCIAVPASCIEFWKPIEDLTYEEVLARCCPTPAEASAVGMKPSHLIDDFVMSRNLAMYGLKYTTLTEVFGRMGVDANQYFHHDYFIPLADRLPGMRLMLNEWNINDSLIQKYRLVK